MYFAGHFGPQGGITDASTGADEDAPAPEETSRCIPVSPYRRAMEPGNDELLTIPEAIEKLRISRTHFFRLKREGVITDIRLGHRTLIPGKEIQRLIDERYHPPKSDG